MFRISSSVHAGTLTHCTTANFSHSYSPSAHALTRYADMGSPASPNWDGKVGVEEQRRNAETSLQLVWNCRRRLQLQTEAPPCNIGSTWAYTRHLDVPTGQSGTPGITARHAPVQSRCLALALNCGCSEGRPSKLMHGAESSP